MKAPDAIKDRLEEQSELVENVENAKAGKSKAADTSNWIPVWEADSKVQDFKRGEHY